MKAKAGLLGPKDSVQNIMEIAADFQSKLEVIPYIYNEPSESEAIVEQNQHFVDFWICTGYTPYYLTKKYHKQQLFFYPRFNQGSIAIILLNILYKDRKNIERISIDSFFKQQFIDLYQENHIPLGQLHLLHNVGLPSSEIVEYHANLFRTRKVDICITSLRSVYEKLVSMNILVYRVTATKENIKQTISEGYEKWEKFHFRNSQIAVMMIKIGEMMDTAAKDSISYDLHRLNLKIQNSVLDFAESVSGSFITTGIGSFLIFSTRGSIERNSQEGNSLLFQIELLTDSKANVGIGYGDTAMIAEKNAILALEHAEAYGTYTGFLVDDKGNITGPLHQKKTIGFNYRVTDEELSNKLKKAGVTISTYNKMASVQKNLGKHAITAADISEWLKMTARNARRILTNLEEQGLAKIIGEEVPLTRGRPRKIYRIGT